jgi:hypothetical protein
MKGGCFLKNINYVFSNTQLKTSALLFFFFFLESLMPTGYRGRKNDLIYFLKQVFILLVKASGVSSIGNRPWLSLALPHVSPYSVELYPTLYK